MRHKFPQLFCALAMSQMLCVPPLRAEINGGIKAVFKAEYEAHYDEVESLIKAGVDVNVEHDDGYTLLMDAISPKKMHSIAGKDEIIKYVKFLISSGSNVNHIAHDGTTPMILAYRFGEAPEIMPLLSAHGAKLLNLNNLLEKAKITRYDASMLIVEFTTAIVGDASLTSLILRNQFRIGDLENSLEALGGHDNYFNLTNDPALKNGKDLFGNEFIFEYKLDSECHVYVNPKTIEVCKSVIPDANFWGPYLKKPDK